MAAGISNFPMSNPSLYLQSVTDLKEYFIISYLRQKLAEQKNQILFHKRKEPEYML